MRVYAQFSTVSPLALDENIFPRVATVLDASLASSSSLFALHAQSSRETLFLSGKDIATYLRHLEKEESKVQEVDFEALKTEVPAPAPAPAKAQKEKEDAKIEGAVQVAIGVKKEVDFASWYTNVRASEYLAMCTDYCIGSDQGRYARLLQRQRLLHTQALVV